MSDFSTIKAQIQELIDNANAATGNADTNLTSAVGALIIGYGVGGSAETPGTLIMSATINVTNTFDVEEGCAATLPVVLGLSESTTYTVIFDGETCSDLIPTAHEYIDGAYVLTVTTENNGTIKITDAGTSATIACFNELSSDSHTHNIAIYQQTN